MKRSNIYVNKGNAGEFLKIENKEHNRLTSVKLLSNNWRVVRFSNNQLGLKYDSNGGGGGSNCWGSQSIGGGWG